MCERLCTLSLDALEDFSDDPKVQGFFSGLSETLKIDSIIQESGANDILLAKLYLDNRSVELFEAYQSIHFHAVVILKALALPMGAKFVKKDGKLRADVERAIPSSKEGFEEFGEQYAYYWVDFLSEEVLKSLRLELSGEKAAMRDAASISNVSLLSVAAQAEVRRKIETSELPKEILTEPLTHEPSGE